MSKTTAGGPSADTVYPMAAVGHDICFLKNVITNPNIEVGDYTYYHDYAGADLFEKRNVIYHEPILEDKLIIGKFCQIAMGTRFLMNASHHQMEGFSTFPFGVFSEEWRNRYNCEYPVKGDTVVGNDVWFGHDCLVMPGVKLAMAPSSPPKPTLSKMLSPTQLLEGIPEK